MNKTKQEKLERLTKAFESLDDDAFEKWLDEQPDEYGVLFYELMFPPPDTDRRPNKSSK